MTTEARYPNFVRGAAALGIARLSKVAADAKIAIDPARATTAEDIARALLARFKVATEIWQYISTPELETIGPALGMTKAAWKPKLSAEEIAKLPAYRRPSYTSDVFYLFLEDRPVAAVRPARVKAVRAVHASGWRELASLAAWKQCAPAALAALAATLARALGDAFVVEAAVGAHGFVRVRDRAQDASYVAIVGGVFAMGLGASEARDLGARAKRAGAEAVAHAAVLVKRCRPVRKVKVAPFLLAETPLLASHVDKRGIRGADTANSHRVARFDGEDAAAAVARCARRLPSEAEWEYVARAGGAQAWLCGAEDPVKYARRLLRAPLAADDHPFGVRGLAWGDWIADGRHDTYARAPATSIAWQPRAQPGVTRGGALALYPWQVGGEALLLHAAARDFDDAGSYCVRPVIDLPARPRSSR